MAVRRVAECGLPGVDSLVRLAGSPQAVTADAAREALLNELAAWEMESRVGGDVELFSRRLQTLAGALDRHAAHFDAEGRQWAGHVAQQLVEHGDVGAGRESLELLRCCERVLALAPVGGRRLGRPGEIHSPLPATLTESAIAGGAPSPAPAATIVAPVEPQVAPPLTAAPLRVAQAPVGEISVVPGAPAALPPTPPPAGPSADEVNPLRTQNEPAGPRTPNVAEAQPLPAPPRRDLVVDVPSPAESRHMMRRYRQLTDVELAALMDAGSPYESLAVRQVLRERGSAAATAQRPRSVTDASREKLLETLSRLPAAEGRVMLRRLVVDDDAEVRLQALTILATTDDPQLTAIVRRRAVEDADPRVTELASRILKERK